MKSSQMKSPDYIKGYRSGFKAGAADVRHSLIEKCDYELEKIGDNCEMDAERAVHLMYRVFGKTQNKRDKARRGGR